MAIPFALMSVGTVMQVASQWRANMEQAKAEKRNAEYYEAQANFVREAEFRDMQLTEAKYTQIRGTQISLGAKGGADTGSASFSNVLASTAAAKIEELLAAKKKGELDFQLASMRGENSTQTANTLGSDTYNATQAGATIIGNYARYKSGDA